MEKQCPTCGHTMTGTFQNEDLAKGAYSAYGRSTGYKNFMGGEMPEWDQLPESIREAWRAAVKFVFDQVA